MLQALSSFSECPAKCQCVTIAPCDTICHSQEDGFHHSCSCCSNGTSFYYKAWFAFGKLLLPLPDHIFVPYIVGNCLQGTWCDLPPSQGARGGCSAVLPSVILPLFIKRGHDMLLFSSHQVPLRITLIMAISFHLSEAYLACRFKYIQSFSVSFNQLLLGCWLSISFPNQAAMLGHLASGAACEDQGQKILRTWNLSV